MHTWHDAEEAGLGRHSCPHADAFVPTRRRLCKNAVGPVGVPVRGQGTTEASSNHHNHLQKRRGLYLNFFTYSATCSGDVKKST